MLSRILALCALCAIAYGPTLSIPLSQDDYPNIMQARAFTPSQPLGDSTFRLRSTSYWLIEAIQPFAGVRAWRYHAVSLLLHVLCTLLVYALARLWRPMETGAFAAAAFFAIYEGHQEAVMWFSAVNELLLFGFGIGAVVCWLLAARSVWWHVPGILLFGLALLSKESAVIVLGLMLLVRWNLRLFLLPYLALCCAALASVAQSHTNSFRFSDGSFSLHAPFWLTLPHSAYRLVWLWGMVALFIWIWRKLEWRPVALNALWIAMALAPYSFLTYSTAIPSRQLYLASAGLAMIVGLAFSHLFQVKRRIAVAIAVLAIVGNAGYLWTKKREQFLVRAAPTEALLKRLTSSSGPVNGACFPLIRLVAEDAVRFAQPENVDRLAWDPKDCSSK